MAACVCGNEKKVIITACSGAANTGLLADQVARALRTKGIGSMTCMAALGAALPAYVEGAKAADLNIVVDGCPVGCGMKIYGQIGAPCDQYIMTDFGAEKGKTPITEELVASTADRVAAAIEARHA